MPSAGGHDTAHFLVYEGHQISLSPRGRDTLAEPLSLS